MEMKYLQGLISAVLSLGLGFLLDCGGESSSNTAQPACGLSSHFSMSSGAHNFCFLGPVGGVSRSDLARETPSNSVHVCPAVSPADLIGE